MKKALIGLNLASSLLLANIATAQDVSIKAQGQLLPQVLELEANNAACVYPNECPVLVINPGSSDDFTYDKTDNAKPMYVEATYKIDELEYTSYDYSFTIRIALDDTGNKCEIINKRLGAGSAISYEVVAAEPVFDVENGIMQCNVDIERIETSNLDPDTHYFDNQNIDELRTISNINKLHTFKNNSQSYLAVAAGLDVKNYKLNKNNPNLIEYSDSGDAYDTLKGSDEETIYDVQAFTMETGSTYLAIAGSNPSGESAVYIFKADSTGKFEKTPSQSIIVANTKKIKDIEIIQENDSTVYIIVTPAGNKSHGYVQELSFYKVTRSGSTYSNEKIFTNDKIVGFNPQNTASFKIGSNQYFFLSNYNNPLKKSINSVLYQMDFTENLISEVQKIETHGAKNATFYSETVNAVTTHYLAIADTYKDVEDYVGGVPSIQLYAFDETEFDALCTENCGKSGPHQLLNYKLKNPSGIEYSYLMSVNQDGGKTHYWDGKAMLSHSNNAFDITNPNTNISWEFVDMGNGHYYMIAPQVINGTQELKIVQPYSVQSQPINWR